MAECECPRVRVLLTASVASLAACECARMRMLLNASLANVQECECARVRVRLSATIVVLALLHVLLLEVVQVLHEPAALSTPDYRKTVALASARVTVLIAAILSASDRGGRGGGDKFRIGQKLYRAKRFYVSP